MAMLTEICQELKNWFDRGQPKWFGAFSIDSEGNITFPTGSDNPTTSLQTDQYFRVIGSVFNDGVYKYGTDTLTEETFNGSIWAMAIPAEVVSLSEEIDGWNQKYGGIDSAAMSPYNSESFAGYSYSKSGGGASSGLATGSAGSGTWQSVFASRLKLWRKV